MSRILITGSTDGFGLEAARQLVQLGHQVYLHARSTQRASDAEKACPGAAGTLIADLSSVDETKKLAEEANKIGTFDVVIHNAGLYLGPFRKTPDTGMPAQVFVNVLAPYILTCLMHKPKRLIYISSILHKQGNPDLKDMFWFERGEEKWNDFQSYCDTKVQVNLVANAIARRWKGTNVLTVHPGWVATKLGGAQAPDRLEDGVETYVKLAVGNYDQSLTGAEGYFEPRGKLGEQVPACKDVDLQEKAVQALEKQTGLKIPA
ncbi:hypothetical protein BDV11DRAFT_199293 [Aspergillus similis]